MEEGCGVPGVIGIFFGSCQVESLGASRPFFSEKKGGWEEYARRVRTVRKAERESIVVFDV
jgi:hypothetical protein